MTTADTERRGRLLYVTLGFLGLDVVPAAMPPALTALHRWLDTWAGIENSSSGGWPGKTGTWPSRGARPPVGRRPFYVKGTGAFCGDEHWDGLTGNALGRDATGRVGRASQGRLRVRGARRDGRVKGACARLRQRKPGRRITCGRLREVAGLAD